MKEWWTLSELGEARLPGLPGSMQGVHKIAIRGSWTTKAAPDGRALARRRQGRGGGWEYHVSLLPLRARRELEMREIRAALAEPETRPTPGDGEAWAAYERKPAGVRQEAERRMRALMEWERLTDGGMSAGQATARLAHTQQLKRGTIYAWRRLVRDLPRSEWLPALAPAWKGRTVTAACSPEAWEAFKADYLRLEEPSARSCYDRLVAAAAKYGWTVPSIQTLTRRIERELPAPLLTYLRKGEKALARTYPAQQRSRAHFHALQGVNSDGHTADVWVRWPDGEVRRPTVVLVQDLYSNKLLSRRIDKSESTAAVRLAFYDLHRDWGIADFATLDNGRAFASKQMTGGQPTRFRFKVTKDEMDGCLTALGTRVHWTNPYSGQSKPIERAFRDFADRGARHPRLAGAYAGNSPSTKPDYAGGVKPVPLETFVAVWDEWMAEYNGRRGRRTEVANGRSFDEVFAESYATSPVRKATAEQLRLAMLAATRVTARAPDGSVRVLGNRYWGEFLSNHIGARVTVRFDPEDLGAPAWIYASDGAYLGEAECWEAVGFNSVEAAREHARKRRAYLGHVRAAAKIEQSLTAEELVALHGQPAGPSSPAPTARVVRMLPTRGANALKPADEPSGMTQAEVLRLAVSAIETMGKQR